MRMEERVKQHTNFAPVIQPNANLGLLQGDFAEVIEVPNWLMLSQGHHPQWACTNSVSPYKGLGSSQRTSHQTTAGSTTELAFSVFLPDCLWTRAAAYAQDYRLPKTLPSQLPILWIQTCLTSPYIHVEQHGCNLSLNCISYWFSFSSEGRLNGEWLYVYHRFTIRIERDSWKSMETQASQILLWVQITRDTDWVSRSGWGLRVCIPNKLPVDTNTADQWTQFNQQEPS